MNHRNTETTTKLNFREAIQNRLTKLEQTGFFPNELHNAEENLIVNFCKEQRWTINNTSDSVPAEFHKKQLLSSVQSLARIDEIVHLLDKRISFKHTWSRMVTYIDLVKIFQNGVQIRLRYEFTGTETMVKWIVVDSINSDENVFILIAENEKVASQWEQRFLELPSSKKAVSIKVLKYFLLDAEGELMEDYLFTELDDDRLEGDLDSKRLNFKTTSNFVGVFVQDRFKLPLLNNEQDGLLDFPQIMDLVKNELRNQPDKLAVLSRYNLRHDEIRIELETHLDEKATLSNFKLQKIKNTLEDNLLKAEDLNILTRK